jgi:hypothetical protein
MNIEELFIYTATFPLFLICGDTNCNTHKYSYDYTLSCSENNRVFVEKLREIGVGYMLQRTNLSKQK